MTRFSSSEIFSCTSEIPMVNAPALAGGEADGGWAFFFGGAYECAPGGGLYGVRTRWGALSASPARCIRADPGGAAFYGNAVPMREDGVLWLYAVVSEAGNWERSRIEVLHSPDEGATWRFKGYLPLPRGFLVGTAAVRKLGGGWCLPVYDEIGWQSYVLLGTRAGGPWELSPAMHCGVKGIQPALWEDEHGGLQALVRTRRGRLIHTGSPDGGYSWTRPRITDLPNPNSRIAVAYDRGSRRLLLAYNPCDQGRPRFGPNLLSLGRQVLRLALSPDGGGTWPVTWRSEVACGFGEYAYPWLASRGHGRYLLAYQDCRLSIRVLEFAADDLVEANPQGLPHSLAELRDWRNNRPRLRFGGADG